MFKKYNGYPTRLKNPYMKPRKNFWNFSFFDCFSQIFKAFGDLWKKFSRIFKGDATGKSFQFNNKKNIGNMKEHNKWTLSTKNIRFSDLFLNIRSMSIYLKGLIVCIIIALLITFGMIIKSDFYKVKSLVTFRPNITTKIYDKNNLLISELFRQKRDVVSLDRIPRNLINAFIAIEDNEFYDHFGINIKGIVRAFFINIFAGRIRQGGSTITQQLSKILLTSRKRNIYRKIKEAVIAVMMEFFYTKDKIMELYLNQIFLGHGAYGVESASKFYFGKNVWDLNLAQSALLATLPTSPNRLSPIRHPKKSMGRHKIVLAKMVERGFISISDAETVYLSFWPKYLEFINELPPSHNTRSKRLDRAPWFTEYIRRKLIKKYGEEIVYQRGLLVYTTLDIFKQAAGQRILKEALERQTVVSRSLSFKNEDYLVKNYSDLVNMFSLLYNIKRFRKGSIELKKYNDYFKSQIIDRFESINYLIGFDNIGNFFDFYRESHYEDKDIQKVEGCLISIDHRNGYIEAMIGGSEFSSINQLNRVVQSKRQPGSAIKPLLYAAALDSKIFTPASSILDSPIVFLDNEGGDWIPENYEGRYSGFVRLRRALEKSINVISLRIADTLGIDYVIEYYAKLLKINDNNVQRRIPRNFSIVLGSLEVSPFELARSYAIIANRGRDVIPFSIRYIKDQDGNILENIEEEVFDLINKKKNDGSLQIINPETAQMLTNLLESVITSGTGLSAAIGRPAGGKTGTTNNWRDAWFVGFAPQLTSCIWMGYDSKGLSLGIGQSGGTSVAPIWGKYMKEALKKNAIYNFKYSTLIKCEICTHSGQKSTPYCRNTIHEVYIPGTAPESECEECITGKHKLRLVKKGPRKNISKKYKNLILKNIKKSENNNSILDDIGNDLLD